jgi:hypothetical protein
MRHLVLVSISSFCFALVASVGLAAYTAAHPEAAGVATVSGPEGPGPVSQDCRVRGAGPPRRSCGK